MSTPALVSLRADLARADLRNAVARAVGARVPRDDAEDVVQSVLCAALAAEEVPAEPARRARWVAGIARHKVADYHRTRRRELPHGASPDCAPGACVEASAPPTEHEAREILNGVFHDLRDDARALETLRWIVREHEGERLADIARAERLSAAAVRQRVSRLRRTLRDKWLPVVAAFLAAATLAIRRPWQTPSLEQGSSAAVPVDSASDPLAALAGEWVVVEVHPAEGVPVRTAAIAASLVGTRVHVEHHDVTIASPLLTVTGRLGLVAAADGDLELELTDAAGAKHPLRGRRSGSTIVIHGVYGAFQGRIIIAR